MAQLKDTVVSGNLRVTEKIFVEPTIGDITWNTSVIGSAPSVLTKSITQIGRTVNIQLYVEFATALTVETENIIGTLTGVDVPKNVYRDRCWQGVQYYSGNMQSCYVVVGTTGNIGITPPTGATNKKYLINITYQT